MAEKILKGIYYGSYIDCDNLKKIETIILQSGILQDDEKILNPNTPDKQTPFKEYPLVSITYSGDIAIGNKKEMFIGVKLNEDSELFQDFLIEAHKQLDSVFKRIHPLEKKDNYHIHTLMVII